MHQYAVFNHNRDLIGRWLGVSSLLIAGGIAETLVWLEGLSGWQVFAKATITTALVYFFLHWLFSKYIWKAALVGVPDINGSWDITGSTLGTDGTNIFQWDGRLTIEQDWKTILVTLRTSESRSLSYTATIFKHGGDRSDWILTYSYKNEPDLEQSHEMNSHRGYCEIVFDRDFRSGKGSYFNSSGRRTAGVMELVKEDD